MAAALSDLSFGLPADTAAPVPVQQPQDQQLQALPHAMIRAQERYGIELSWPEFEDISQRCLKGEGCTERLPDGKSRHMIIFGERVLWVVFHAGSREGRGAIVTIMPPEMGAKQSVRDSRQKFRRLHGFVKRRGSR